jgi:hypothetical protein
MSIASKLAATIAGLIVGVTGLLVLTLGFATSLGDTDWNFMADTDWNSVPVSTNSAVPCDTDWNSPNPC